ncbi:hypothetical protein Tco_1018134 [Tanacetum coccineum]|uniref:Uncharacterized protein n=1 Tax=Tanacetum coccineum TaxID=301880 RepID=A0ABQ5FTV6_9ASTR
MIDDDLFTCDTPLGPTFDEFNRLSRIDDDLFTYEVRIPGLSCPPYDEPQCDNLKNYDHEVYERNLCYDEEEKSYAEAIDTDLFTRDIPIFKTYEEYKNAWIHEWNKDVPWVPEEPWSGNGVPYEIVDHHCVPFHLKSGHVEWPTCHSNDDGYCDGGYLPGMIQNKNIVYFQDYEWHGGLEDGKLKDKALMKKAEFEES